MYVQTPSYWHTGILVLFAFLPLAYMARRCGHKGTENVSAHAHAQSPTPTPIPTQTRTRIHGYTDTCVHPPPPLPPPIHTHTYILRIGNEIDSHYIAGHNL